MSLNQIIDQDPLSSLVVDNTLNLKARKLRVFGNVEAGSFSVSGGGVPAQSTVSVPFTVVCYDGTTERAVTGIGVSGNLEFVKTGKLVTVLIPDFQITAFSGGAASQLLRIKYTSPLPVSVQPSYPNSIPVTVESGTTTLSTPGLAFILGSSHILLTSNSISGTFTVNCGVVRPSTLVYFTA